MVVDDECWQDEHQFIPVHRRSLGYVFQEASLFAHLSVRGNLEYGLRRLSSRERRVATDQVIDWMGLSSLIDRRPDGLSGGERQRVAIGRALLRSPRVLLMDEPLSALDNRSKKEILPYLEALHEHLDIPVVYVTHSVDEVARLADHLVVLESGSVLATGSLQDVCTRLDLPMNLSPEAGATLDARVAERDAQWHLARVEFDGGSLWARDQGYDLGKRVRVRVLARDLSISAEPIEHSSILNSLAARVEAIATDEHPGVRLVRVRLGEHTALLARVTARSVQALGLQPGSPVWVQVKSMAVIE